MQEIGLRLFTRSIESSPSLSRSWGLAMQRKVTWTHSPRGRWGRQNSNFCFHFGITPCFFSLFSPCIQICFVMITFLVVLRLRFFSCVSLDKQHLAMEKFHGEDKRCERLKTERKRQNGKWGQQKQKCVRVRMKKWMREWVKQSREMPRNQEKQRKRTRNEERRTMKQRQYVTSERKHGRVSACRREGVGVADWLILDWEKETKLPWWKATNQPPPSHVGTICMSMCVCVLMALVLYTHETSNVDYLLSLPSPVLRLSSVLASHAAHKLCTLVDGTRNCRYWQRSVKARSLTFSCLFSVSVFFPPFLLSFQSPETRVKSIRNKNEIGAKKGTYINSMYTKKGTHIYKYI